MVGTKIFRLESDDFAEMEYALSAWDHQYRQISPGAFYGGLLHTQIGSLGIFRNRWERAIHYQGVAPKGSIALAVTLAQSGEGYWMGHRMGPDDMIVAGCGAEGEYRSASLWDSVVFAIPEAELMQQIADIGRDNPDDIIIGSNGVAHLTAQVAAQVRQACLVYLDTASRFSATPDASSPLPEMAKSIIELMAHALISSQPLRHEKQSLSRQRQCVRKAEEYSTQSMDQPLRIGQLCREISLSERTLRDAFYNITGTSPLDYLKTQRLNRVYRALHDSDPNETLIKQIAYANGFCHLGQFCRDYQQLFGELPSATLQRC